MLCAKSNRITGLATLVVFSALFFCGGSKTAIAQEPPTTIPPGGPPAYDPNAITLGRWLLYPSLNLSVENSNNFFLSPSSKISGWQFGVTPSATGVWSDGINTTTVYGNFQQLEYPTNNVFNASNGEGTFTQQYAPLRDLNFTFVADYLHQTLQGAFTNSIPNPTPFTGFSVLPNGNVVLPNGNIVNPSGQVVGQTAPSVSASPFQSINPYDQYTATGRVQKLFNDGIVTLGASLARTNYVNAEVGGVANTNFTNKTYTEDTAFWLGPTFYFYSSGTFNDRTTNDSATGPSLDSSAYRVVGGIGTRQFGLFRASAYFGHQGSTGPGSGTSTSNSQGGNVFGGTLSYYPTPPWTVSLGIDETINLAPANAAPSTQALFVPGITPLQIALSNSTQITSTTLRSSYEINQQWTASGTFAYTHIENIGSPIWDNTYFVDAQLTYNMWRNLTLSWEYQYSKISSNAPLSSTIRNLGLMSATYKF